MLFRSSRVVVERESRAAAKEGKCGGVKKCSGELGEGRSREEGCWASKTNSQEPNGLSPFTYLFVWSKILFRGSLT